MIVKASCCSQLIKPKLYNTASLSSITQAEQQDRFLQLGELNQLVSFFNSGSKRLEIVDILAKNSNFLVSKAADKIFVGGSAISYLEKPQTISLDVKLSAGTKINQSSFEDLTSNNSLSTSSSIINLNQSLPPGFKPISIVRYGSVRMKKSLRDLDWFLRYLTYALVAGDTNILSVNIRGLRELIDSACSSAAAIVALREMRKLAINLFDNDLDAQGLVQDYFNVVISEFELPSLGDKLRKRFSSDLQGLRLPQVYSNAGSKVPKFVMKSSLSNEEKNIVIKACYRQIFERDILKAYNFSFNDLESQLKTGRLSVKEFIRALGKSPTYRQQFSEPFVNSRVVELCFKHFLGRGLSSIDEFQKYFSILSSNGLSILIDTLINCSEYADYFGEETVPYLRGLGEEAQECKNWGAQIRLFNYSSVFKKVPEFITLFSDYKNSLPDQHPYGLSNDPLNIQFGAIFINNYVYLRSKSAFFGRYTRRILLRQGPSIYNQVSRPDARQIKPGTLGPKVFTLNYKMSQALEENENIDKMIKVIYLRIFGRLLYQNELLSLKSHEQMLKNQKITIRGFIRLIMKSDIFRSLYWNSFYICKAIEYVHNKVFGRPTYGRQEINKYFDIVYKNGYYAMIDNMLDSSEYIESFGDNIVPYERYVTSSTLISRKLASGLKKLDDLITNQETYSILGKVKEKRSSENIINKINQGVTAKRDQIKIFKLYNNLNSNHRIHILRAVYRQLFERDLNSFIIGDEFYNLEKAFLVGELNVQQLVEKVGTSLLYQKEFYHPYPNTKVIELGTKHFLGRAPNNQAEIRYYNQILASQGILSFVTSLVNSDEYNSLFNKNTVPYRRFPTLPAANFPNTQKLYNKFVKQNENIVVSSFS
uniref:Phycobiliprotein ApcE n=1 Tax=Platysiphonia delicata TaxID=2006979 RepID=A0A1Z1M0K4_9FLOR|nr:phycobilisome linker polypeptide [Platysiphonia delicata]ARW59596.1 phycobilisome linker polypeptide [Platysiphonia delicata]